MVPEKWQTTAEPPGIGTQPERSAPAKFPFHSALTARERGGLDRGVPVSIVNSAIAAKFPGLIANEGIAEITETYSLFARSFADEGLIASPRHVEFLIDKQGYIRARWLPTENQGWRDIQRLSSQVELLRKEKPRAPPPEEHVH